MIRKVINELRTIHSQSENVPSLFLGDFNARSTRWGDRRDNNNSDFVNEILIDFKPTILNNPSCGPTFSGNRGKSFIDLTLANQLFIDTFSTTWLIDFSIFCISDHHPISISFNYSNNQTTNPPTENTPTVLTSLKFLDQLVKTRPKFDIRIFENYWNERCTNSEDDDRDDPDEYCANLVNQTHSCIIDSAKQKKLIEPLSWWSDSESPQLFRSECISLSVF